MRTTIYGKDSNSGVTFHIDDVQKELKQKFICNCGNPIFPIKSKARKKEPHFRHPAKSDIVRCRQKGLHDFVQQLLLNSSTIFIAKLLHIEYTEQQKEQWLEKLFRSDVSGTHETLPIHFEIVVSNDLSDEKKAYYINNKIRCVRIDLTNKELLIASPEVITDLVLNQWENKTLLGWEDAPLVEVITTQTIIADPEHKIESIENANYTNSKKTDPVLTFLKWLGYAILVYVFYRILFAKRTSYVTVNRKVNRKTKNRFRKF